MRQPRRGQGASLHFEGMDNIHRGLSDYERKVQQAVEGIANYFAPILESYAKEEAIWTDRTANARQTLHAFTRRLGEDAVAIYLAGGVFYQLYLETRFQGRYAIIWPTIEAHLGQIKRMLDQIFR